MNAASTRVMIFDSGMGGLTVARAVMAVMPDADLVYAADNAAFPYGDWTPEQLVERMTTVLSTLIRAHRPDVIVIACNTASTVALAAMRQRFSLPFVGTVPAIKPAAERTESGIIGILATPGTVRREYTRALIDTYASHCRVILHGAPRLAELAERKLAGRNVEEADIRREILPVFRRRAGKATDTVVLACTHYPLLLDDIAAAAPWPVAYIDPADAIARQVCAVAGTASNDRRPQARRPPVAVFTGKRGLSDARLAAYERMGFARHEIVSVPR